MKRSRKKPAPRVPKRIPGASSSNELRQIVKLSKAGKSVDDIAEAVGRHRRHVVEVLRIFEKCIPQIRDRVLGADRTKAISVRVAARAADLRASDQRKLARRLEGKDQREGLRVIRSVETRRGTIHRGQKAKFPVVRKIGLVCTQMEAIVQARLRDAPSDPAARIVLRVLRVLRGDLEADRVLPPRGRSGSPSRRGR